MFTIVQRYSRSLILKKKKGKKYTEPEEIDDQATQTALSFMSQYIYRPGFHCGTSFAGMINPKVLETLYKNSIEDHHASLNMLMGNTNMEFEDMQETANFEALYDNAISTPGEFLNQVSLKEILGELLREFDAKVSNEMYRFKLRALLQILLRKSKNKHSKNTFQKYICNKKENDLCELFALELYNRLAVSVS